MHKEELKSKFAGCLVGTAIGDGLGAWREGRGMAKEEDIASLIYAIASMVGAISVAYLSIEAIPQEWRAKLENRAYIEALAEELWQLTTD